MIIFASKIRMAAVARHIMTLNSTEKSLKGFFSQKLINSNSTVMIIGWSLKIYVDQKTNIVATAGHSLT